MLLSALGGLWHGLPLKENRGTGITDVKSQETILTSKSMIRIVFGENRSKFESGIVCHPSSVFKASGAQSIYVIYLGK